MGLSYEHTWRMPSAPVERAFFTVPSLLHLSSPGNEHHESADLYCNG